jgi:HlyD family type I secretion membrane fusion protein
MSDINKQLNLLALLAWPLWVALSLVLIFFGVFGTWAAFAPLQSAAIAPGYISVESKRKTVQHLDGGIVSEILIQDGDKVKTGDILLRLDDSLAKAALDLLEGQYIDLLAEESRLSAEQKELTHIEFNPYLEMNRSTPRVTQAVEAQLNVFAARSKAMQSKTEILRARIKEIKEQIRGFQIQQEASKKRLVLIEEEREDLEKAVSKGHEARTRLMTYEREKVEIEGIIGEITPRISHARLRIGETRLEILDLQTNLLNKVSSDLHTIHTRVLNMVPRMETARETLKRMTIRAPDSGIVVGLRYYTEGGVIPPGGSILDIVPDRSRYIVEAQINPQDIDVVKLGMPTEVRLTAFSLRNTPTVRGYLSKVSADHMRNETTGQAYYSAEVRLDLSRVTDIKPEQLYPGMPVDVLIITGERTTLDYLLTPINDSLSRAFREQ